MTGRLANKTAIVTAAAQGIGEATAGELSPLKAIVCGRPT